MELLIVTFALGMVVVVGQLGELINGAS